MDRPAILLQISSKKLKMALLRAPAIFARTGHAETVLNRD